MGLNLDDLWGQAKEAMDKGLEQVKSVGVPALTSAAEKWAANVLEEQKKSLLGSAKEADRTLQTNVNTILKAPQSPGSFGSFFSETIAGAGVGAGGPMILLGIGAVLIVGIWLGRK